MTADFENLLLGNKKLKDNDLDGAIYNFHLILKEKKIILNYILKILIYFVKIQLPKKTLNL